MSDKLFLFPENSASPVVYTVDDDEDLTELYATLLRAAGYCVRAFTGRAEALASLKVERSKPQLLITDIRGGSIPVECFISDCVAVHPTLQILMASGFPHTETRFSRVRPNRFLRKPFTSEEFLREVRAVLASDRANSSLRLSRG